MTDDPASLVRASTIEEKLLALAAEHLGVSTAELNLARLTGDASARTYYRVSAQGQSIIVALYGKPFDETEAAARRLEQAEAGDPACRLTFANDPCAHIEVTELFRRAGLPVPAILRASGAIGALLIEDVGDTRLQDWLTACSPAELEAAYRRAVSMIVTIQDATHDAIATGSICSRLAFDEAKLGWELRFFFENYFGRHLGVRLNSRRFEEVISEFNALCSELAARPRVLTHRDYHARNLMVHNGQMFIIDHQDARLGPQSYDLASLLNDPYAGLDEAARVALLEAFISLKARSKQPLDRVSAFREEFALMTIQRTLKAVGTYSYQCTVGRNEVYLPYIKPALESALRSMRELGRFGKTRAVIEETWDRRPS